MNKSERNDRGGSKAERGQNDNFGKNPTYKKFPSSSSKAKQQEDVKKESPSKEDFLLFDDDDKPSNNKSIQKNQPNERPSNAIDTIFKKLKKGREEYSKLESQSFEPKRDKEKISGLLLEPSKDFLGVPWMSKKTMAISSSLVRAHNEIIEFVNYIVPTKEDHRVREKSLEKLTNKIMVVYPDCIVKPFGSFTTKVYLPNADIDLVVVKTDINSTTLLHVLAQKLMKDEEYEQFQIIRSAKVPLIKLVEKSTGINFDISFNKLDGVKQIKIVEGAFELYPEMRYLIIVLKVMLRQRDLHETYHGGVGSFLLFCLVLTFVREIKKDFITINKRDQIQELLLSDMLLLLFEYYGINFDLNTKGITIANGGAIVDKIERDNSLSVISPQDPTHDIGGPSYRIKDVFNVFKNRYHFLTNYNFKEGESFMQFLVDPGMIEGWKK